MQSFEHCKTIELRTWKVFQKHISKALDKAATGRRTTVPQINRILQPDGNWQWSSNMCGVFMLYACFYICILQWQQQQRYCLYNNNGPSMQAGTVAGLKCILRIRRVHWRKLGFVLLYYFAFTYVCVNTQSHTQQTDWLALTILLTQRKRLAVKAVAIFMRTFISGRAASA